MRRSVWEAVGGYPAELRFNEDWDFWIAAMELGASVTRIPRPLYFYRHHAHSLTATRIDDDLRTRELILKKRVAFFAVGDRAKTFRTKGLLASAHAHRAVGHQWRSIMFTARAISAEPKLFLPETKTVVHGFARKIKRNARATIRKVLQTHLSTNNKEANLSPLDWESQAQILHNRFGYLSHDFSVLGSVIDKIKAHSVLEIGCGSGRLVPIYLAYHIQPIWLQDLSERALDICRERFFCQTQIRYIHGNVQSIPMSTEPDLVVTNRVLQHIVDDEEFIRVINYLIPMTHYLYINEAEIKEARSINWPYLKGRDYIGILRDLGCRLIEQDELMAESGPQKWMLFATEKALDNPVGAERQLDAQHLQ
jgi:Methyltransferase domain